MTCRIATNRSRHFKTVLLYYRILIQLNWIITVLLGTVRMQLIKPLLLSTLLLSSFSLQAANDTACNETELRNAVARFGEAFKTADTQRLDLLLTDNYIHVNGGSGNIIRKQAWLNWLGSRKSELQTGKYRFTHYQVDVLSVVVQDRVAIVVGEAVSAGQRNEIPFKSKLRFSNTWLCEKGQWRRAAFHDSPLKADA